MVSSETSVPYRTCLPPVTYGTWVSTRYPPTTATSYPSSRSRRRSSLRFICRCDIEDRPVLDADAGALGEAALRPVARRPAVGHGESHVRAGRRVLEGQRH